MDQRLDEALSLLYTTQPLEDPVHIIGRPKMVLHVASTATVIGFAISVSDVAPDGLVTSCSQGDAERHPPRLADRSDAARLPARRMSSRSTLTAPRGASQAGHRIRVAIASADWPNVWPTPEPATNTVHRGSAHQSRLILPTVPAAGSATAPALRPSPAHLERHALRAEPPVWEVVHDALTHRAKVRFSEHSSLRITPTTVVSREYELWSKVDTDDPGGASARGRHTSVIRRPSGVTDACSEVTIQGTPSHFHVLLELRVNVNGLTHYSRQWTKSVPRRLL